jgi:hypothetical protein
VTKIKPPKKTLTCKDPDNHRFKCNYIIINKKEINTKVFRKIVFLYVYVTQKHQKLLFENEYTVIPIFVTKTVVKIIHEHEYNGKVRVVVIKEEGDYDTPTSVAINCFAPCFQQEYTRAIIQKTIINTPVFVTTVNQIANIVNNVNTINSVNIINNNLIINAYVNNVNTNNMNIFNPPPPPAYSPTNLFSVPPDTPLYKGGTANPNVTPILIGSSPTGPTNESTPTRQTNQTLLNSSSNTTTLQSSNTPPFNNSDTSPQVNNTIVPPPAPSANNTSPNNTTSSGPTENNTTSNPSTSSNSQAITPGCGQGTDNSTCQSNSNPTSTAQQNNTTSSGPAENNTTSNPSTSSNSQAITPGCGQGTDNSTCQSNSKSPVDCNANPEDPSCPQQNINNNPNQPRARTSTTHTDMSRWFSNRC